MMPTKLQILHTGRGFVVVDKPAGIPVEAYRDHDTVEARAWAHFQRPGSPKRPFVGIVHRLDRPTSGVLVLARNKSTLRRLNRAFQDKQVRKLYLARTQVPLPGENGRLKDYLVKDTQSRRAVMAGKGVSGAKYCELSYSLKGRSGAGFTYEVALVTGRYHQIRAQFSAAGAPIVGDARYGSDVAHAEQQIMLHACRLTVPDLNGVPVTVTSLPTWG